MVYQAIQQTVGESIVQQRVVSEATRRVSVMLDRMIDRNYGKLLTIQKVVNVLDRLKEVAKRQGKDELAREAERFKREIIARCPEGEEFVDSPLERRQNPDIEDR